MNRRLIVVTLAAAAVCVAGNAVPASAAVRVPVHAMFGKTKTVKLSLRNDSGAPVKLKAGETSMTLDAGKTMPVKLPEGTSITIEEATAEHPSRIGPDSGLEQS